MNKESLNTIKSLAIVVSAIIFIMLLAAFTLAPQTFSLTMQYQLDSSSQLYIQGSSNINNFTCYCNEKFEKQTLSAEVLKSGLEIKFNEVILELPTMSLDCGKKRMNKDMYETLKAETYPNIYVDLKRAYRKGSTVTSLTGEWTELTAEATITIAGISQEVDLLVSAKKTGDGIVRLMSHKDLKMSQFGLETPTALLGLIKVHDCININFDLTVKLEDPS